jgi:CheY-like chemotaxis protein
LQHGNPAQLHLRLRDAPLSSHLLTGLNVLLIEDETMISLLIEDHLLELGCWAVWQANSLEAALRILDERKPDFAVVDVNLGGVLCYPVAERLDAGNIPFIFVTGYGQRGVAEPWTHKPTLQKPFRFAAFAEMTGAALAASGRVPKA